MVSGTPFQILGSAHEELGRRGEIVKAFVVLRSGFTGDSALVADLQEHAKKITAPYKYPREIEFVTDIPKTPSGKMLRRVLRDAERKRHQNA